MIWFYLLIFVFSWILLYFAGEWIIGSLMRISKFLGLKEFVVAFFIMAVAGSLPNFFLGISSAIRGIPELSFGDVAGNNLVVLTVALALSTLFSKKGLAAESRTVQTTSLFTMMSAILPLLLIFDQNLSRMDGLVLISFFLIYALWLFSKRERFTKVYDGHEINIFKDFRIFLKDISLILLSLLLMIISSQGIVSAVKYFSSRFDLSLIIIGLFITGVQSTLPELYFAIVSARKGENWMILGDLMGAVIIPATLVLGIVALIHPIDNLDVKPLAIARIFLFISALSFFIFIKTGKRINKIEAMFLLLVYLVFILAIASIK